MSGLLCRVNGSYHSTFSNAPRGVEPENGVDLFCLSSEVRINTILQSYLLRLILRVYPFGSLFSLFKACGGSHPMDTAFMLPVALPKAPPHGDNFSLTSPCA